MLCNSLSRTDALIIVEFKFWLVDKGVQNHAHSSVANISNRVGSESDLASPLPASSGSSSVVVPFLTPCGFQSESSKMGAPEKSFASSLNRRNELSNKCTNLFLRKCRIKRKSFLTSLLTSSLLSHFR